MRKILFILLLFSATSNAQTLYKVVNGVKIEFSQEDYTQWRIDSTNEAQRMSVDSALNAQLKNLKTQILTIAQSAVGVRADQLTATQLRSLYLIDLYKSGAIVPSTLRIDSLKNWVK